METGLAEMEVPSSRLILVAQTLAPEMWQHVLRETDLGAIVALKTVDEVSEETKTKKHSYDWEVGSPTTMFSDVLWQRLEAKETQVERPSNESETVSVSIPPQTL
eukprot:Gregarina_sp_Poly_1__8043@NODE_461_length_8201_cov_115_438530_g375_i0_p10_GENE_NODE_461_length_8201_cov_115_438530_g375_i0NODE_461_length_8201_cov_115_438530_g375_i0_p10_ORF_typecomplete_len105_score19_10DUF4942/PF13708_6/0_19_NODE_461_length_8201_cov_115_438530_g375_i060936407